MGLETPTPKERELKIKSEVFFPIGSSSKSTKFRVLERRKTKNIEKESSEVRNTEVSTTLMVSREHVFTLKQIE